MIRTTRRPSGVAKSNSAPGGRTIAVGSHVLTAPLGRFDSHLVSDVIRDLGRNGGTWAEAQAIATLTRRMRGVSASSQGGGVELGGARGILAGGRRVRLRGHLLVRDHASDARTTYPKQAAAANPSPSARAGEVSRCEVESTGDPAQVSWRVGLVVNLENRFVPILYPSDPSQADLTAPEMACSSQIAPCATPMELAHNPEVAGSNPAPAT
jgi:hypothetical protein